MDRDQNKTFMRKQFKIKKRSCIACKPHKMGWSSRWNDKEKEKMIREDKEMHNYSNFYNRRVLYEKR